MFVILGVPAASLTSVPGVLEGVICPTTVQLMCIIKDLSFLRWFIDGNEVASYIHSSNTMPFPRPATINQLQGINIQIDSAVSSGADIINATSTLTTNTTTLLQAFNMQDFACGTVGIMSVPVTVNFDITGEQIMHISVACKKAF